MIESLGSLGSLEGKYEIIEAIGEGGMGSVFKVRHRILDEIRVVKMMRSHLVHEEDSRERFYREARIAAKARHRNIAQIFDFSVDEGVAFIIMEYIDGVTLQDILADHGPMSVSLALEVAQQSLHALAFVHRLGIIHRDISPDNLMLTFDSDGNPRIKLIDLGLAKVTEADSGLTKEGLFLGKLRYASPEQFQTLQGENLGPPSDVYSFGLVFYELLTGRYPIRGRSLAEMMVGHVSEPPMPFSESDPHGKIPEDLREIVLRSLAKKSEERFENGREFREHVLAVQKNFPYGEAERKEADRARRRRRSEPKVPANRTSDKDRLARAFGAEESSAGRVSASPEALTDGADGVTEGGPPSRESGADAGRVESGQKEGLPPPSRPPLDPTLARRTPAPIEMAQDTQRRSVGVGQQKEKTAPSGGDLPPGGAAHRQSDFDSDVQETIDPPTLPLRQQKMARKDTPRKPKVADPVRRQPAASRRKWVVAAVIGLSILVVAAGLFFRLIPVPFLGSESDGPARTEAVGTLVVNAFPWAQVVEIQNSEGEQIDLEGAEYTPLAISLAPGSYQIVLRHDEFGERIIDAIVTAGETAAERVSFTEIDEDDLLKSLRLVE
jgi:serine/threonine protein kinase